jgi:hypothetical protein
MSMFTESWEEEVSILKEEVSRLKRKLRLYEEAHEARRCIRAIADLESEDAATPPIGYLTKTESIQLDVALVRLYRIAEGRIK